MKRNGILLMLLIVGITAMAQAPMDPKDIMKKSRDQSKLSGLESKTTLEINDGKGTSV